MLSFPVLSKINFIIIFIIIIEQTLKNFSCSFMVDHF